MESITATSNKQVFTSYYLKCFPSVASFVRRKGGSLDEAKDVFQDAIIALYEKKKKDPDGEAIILNENSYLIGIAKNIYLKKMNKDSRVAIVSLDSISHHLISETDIKISDRIYNYIEKAGKKCLELLKGYYFDKLDMTEIAEKFNFSGERSATVQKYKCLEKIRNVIHANSIEKEDFYE